MNNDLTLTTRMNEPVEHASWIDPEAPAPPELNVPLTLREFPRWVRWRTEKSNDGRLIKKPYRIKGGAAKINDPTHWSTFEAARLAVPQLLTIDSLPKGLGFVLGAVNTEIGIGGVDLDTCLINGALEPRAAEIIKRLASYAEVSPSGTGVKVPFRYRLADLLAIRTAMERNGGEGTGRKWARPGEGAHPPAIELYLDSRYFAVTGDACVGSPRDLTTVALTDLLWLVNVAGPAFASTGKTPNGARALIQDNSRSAIAYRKGCALRREGKTFEEMCTALAEDPETAGWTTEKGMANNRRELGRIWDKAAPREQDGFERNSKNVIIDNNQHNIRLALTKLDVRLSYDAFAERILIEGPDQQPVRIFGDAELNHIYLRIDRAMKFRPRIEVLPYGHGGHSPGGEFSPRVPIP